MLMLFRDGKKGCKITCALKLELDSLFFVLLQSHVDSDSFWLASCEKKYAQILLRMHYYIKCASQRTH